MVQTAPANAPPCPHRVDDAADAPICSPESTVDGMTEKAFYHSSNGDQWYLVQEPGTERMSVRHQPNRASGGQSSLIDVVDFLSEGHGPQHEALLRLLGNAEVLGNTDRT